MNLLKTKTLLVAAGLVFSQFAFSQTKTLKIGYTNVDYILSLMPESKTVESELKSYKQQLDNQLQAKIKEFQEKNQAYEKGQSLMTDVVRADKEKELQTMYASIEEFQKNAEASMQKKQLALLQPLLEKVQKAIDDVSNENGYSYVFNSDAGFGTTPFILHAPESDNVSDSILKKLGITPPPASDKSGPKKLGSGSTTTPASGGSLKK